MGVHDGLDAAAPAGHEGVCRQRLFRCSPRFPGDSLPRRAGAPAPSRGGGRTLRWQRRPTGPGAGAEAPLQSRGAGPPPAPARRGEGGRRREILRGRTAKKGDTHDGSLDAGDADLRRLARLVRGDNAGCLRAWRSWLLSPPECLGWPRVRRRGTALWLIVLIKMVTPPLVHWPWSVPSPVAMTSHESVTRPVEPESTVILELATTPDAASPDSPDREIEPMTASSTLEDSQVEISQLESFPAFRALSQNPGVCLVIAWLAGSIGLGLMQARGISGSAASCSTRPRPHPGCRGGRMGRPAPFGPGSADPGRPWTGDPRALVPGPSRAARARQAGPDPRGRALGGPSWLTSWRTCGEGITGSVGSSFSPAWSGGGTRSTGWSGTGSTSRPNSPATPGRSGPRPRDRISYAESLLRICTTLSSDESPSPALGIIGTGRSFERRLTMILRTRVDRRLTAPSLLAGLFLAALALPSWTMAQDPVVIREVQGTVVVSPGASEPDQIRRARPRRCRGHDPRRRRG